MAIAPVAAIALIFSLAPHIRAAITTQPSTQPSASSTTRPAPLTAGAPAPTFRLTTNAGNELNLADLVGKKIVVLYFYPKADTPGCTIEAKGFNAALAQYNKADIAVIGISPDPVPAIKDFSDKYNLAFPLVADTDHQIAAQYGVWQPRVSRGGISYGIARTTFVIGKDGNIAHVFLAVKPQGHEQEVLAWLKDNAPANEKSQ